MRHLVLVSGGFHKDGMVPGADQIDVDEVVKFLGASYGEVSPDGEMALMEPTMTADDLSGITVRTLVMVADDDIVTLEHAIALYRGIANSELAVVPGTSHFLLQEKPALCNRIIIDFRTTEPVPTVAPVRRAQAPTQ